MQKKIKLNKFWIFFSQKEAINSLTKKFIKKDIKIHRTTMTTENFYFLNNNNNNYCNNIKKLSKVSWYLKDFFRSTQIKRECMCERSISSVFDDDVDSLSRWRLSYVYVLYYFLSPDLKKYEKIFYYTHLLFISLLFFYIL